MENIQSNEQPNAFMCFMQKYDQYIVAALGLIALGMLFLPVLYVGEGSINVIEFFVGHYKFGWTMILTVALLVSGVAFSLLKPVNKYFMTAATFTFILALAMLALTKSFFKLNDLAKPKVAYGLILALVFCFLAQLFALAISYDAEKMSVRDIAEEGMLISMAFVLNLITLFKAPTGGSINLQMLPLFVLALRHGPTHGLIAGGIVYGLLTCLTDGYGIQTYPFDYLIGFGSIVVMGAFKNLVFNKDVMDEEGNKTKGFILGEVFIFVAGILSTFVRFVGSTASSMILYETGFVDSLIYNSMYIPISGAIAVFVTMGLFPALVMLNKKFPVKHSFWL